MLGYMSEIMYLYYVLRDKHYENNERKSLKLFER